MSASLTKGLLFSIAAAVLLYLIVGLFADVNAVGLAIAQVGTVGWLTILALSLINYALRFVRWHYYLQLLGHSPPFLTNLYAYIAGFALTLTPGKFGEAGRGIFLKRHGVGFDSSIAVCAYERVLDVAAMLVLMIPIFGFLPGGYDWVIWVALGTVSVALIAVSIISRIDLADRLSNRLIRNAVHWFQQLLRNVDELTGAKPAVIGLLLGVVGWLAEGIALWVICIMLDLNPTVGEAVGIYAAALIFGALTFLPGGLGTTEAAMIALLSLFGASLADGTAATIVCRIATLWFAVALGVLAFFHLSRSGFSPSTEAKRP